MQLGFLMLCPTPLYIHSHDTGRLEPRLPPKSCPCRLPPTQISRIKASGSANEERARCRRKQVNPESR
jgi:hypothetical protein